MDPEANHSLHADFEDAYPVVLAVALARLRDIEAAEDLTQEVIVRGLLRIDQLRDRARLRAWLVGAARHLAANWRRDATRRERSLHCLAELLPRDNASHPQVRAMIDEKTHQQVLEEALAEIDESDREIVLLHFVAGMPKNRIAETLGVHPATVGRRLERILEGLKSRAIERLGVSLRTEASSPARKRRLQQACLAVLALEGTRRAALAAELDAIESLPATFAATTVTGTWAAIAATLTSVPAIIAGICAALVVTAAAVVVNISPPDGAGPSAGTAPSLQAGIGASSTEIPPVAAPARPASRVSTPANEDDIDALLANIPPSEPVRAFIEGRFTDKDGNAVADADIRLHRHSLRLMGEPMYATRTDAGGRYRLDDVVAGIYLFEYKAEGYRMNPAVTLAVNVGATKLGGQPPATIDGEGVSDYRGRFYRGGETLHGIVVDAETDQPVAEADVAFTGLFKGRHVVYASSRTDEEGSFLIEDLFPHVEGNIIIRADGYEITSSKPIKATDSPIILEARKGGRTVQLHVTREDNETLDDVTLGLYHQDIDLVHLRKPDADGIVSFDALPNGRYAVVAFDTAPERMHFLASRILNVHSAMDEDPTPALNISKPRLHKGIVRDSETLEPIGGATIRTSVDYEYSFLGVVTLELMHADTAHADEQGRFLISSSYQNPFKMSLFVQPKGYQMAGLYDQQTLTRSAQGNLDLRLQRLRPIRGIVAMPDGSPAENAEVVGFENTGYGGIQIQPGGSARTPADGSFELTFAKSGFETEFGAMARHGELLFGYTLFPTEPTGDAGQDGTIQLVQASKATIRVRHPDGSPVTSGKVKTHVGPASLAGPIEIPSGTYDLDESGSVQCHIPANWDLIVHYADPNDPHTYAYQKWEMFDPGAQEYFDLEVVSKTRIISGILMDTMGAPLSGVTVDSSGRTSPVMTDDHGAFEISVHSEYGSLFATPDHLWTLSISTSLLDSSPGAINCLVLPRPTPGILRVRDVDGKPVQGAILLQSVVIVPEDPDDNESAFRDSHPYRFLLKPLMLDEEGTGRFEVSGTTSQPEIANSAFARIDVIQEGVALGHSEIVRFTVDQQEELVFEVTLHSRTHSGTVLDASSRKPIANAIVRTQIQQLHGYMSDDPGEEALIRPIDVTDEEGRFTLRMMKGNEEKVLVYHDDYGNQIYSLDSGSDQVLLLDKLASLEGEVHFPPGLRVGQAYVNVSPSTGNGEKYFGKFVAIHSLNSGKPVQYRLENVPPGDVVIGLWMYPFKHTDKSQTSLEWLVVPPANIDDTWHHDIHVPEMILITAYQRRGDIIGDNPRQLRYRLTRTTGQDPRVVLTPQWVFGDDETKHFHTLLAPPGEYRVEIQEQIGNDWNTIETGQTILIGEGIEARLMPEQVRAWLEQSE